MLKRFTRFGIFLMGLFFVGLAKLTNLNSGESLIDLVYWVSVVGAIISMGAVLFAYDRELILGDACKVCGGPAK